VLAEKEFFEGGRLRAKLRHQCPKLLGEKSQPLRLRDVGRGLDRAAGDEEKAAVLPADSPIPGVRQARSTPSTRSPSLPVTTSTRSLMRSRTSPGPLKLESY